MLSKVFISFRFRLPNGKKTTLKSQEANSSLICLQVELYTKGYGLYAATHNFFACKSYGTTIYIFIYCYSPTNPNSIFCHSQTNPTQYFVTAQPTPTQYFVTA